MFLGCSSEGKYLPSIYKVLGLITSTTKKERKRKRKTLIELRSEVYSYAQVVIWVVTTEL
jgi:hypothetical protein